MRFWQGPACLRVAALFPVIAQQMVGEPPVKTRKGTSDATTNPAGGNLLLPSAVRPRRRRTGKVAEIDAKDIKVDFEKGKVIAPKTISTAEELAKAIPDSDPILKKVDFGRDKLVLFAWGGPAATSSTPVCPTTARR